jgi:hypothetical protein
VAGAAGAAGAASCVSSDPADEGMGFDCSNLSYYAEECPDPSGEGIVPTYGYQACYWYSDSRTESVKVLTTCLAALTQPAGGWCGAEHEAAVEACRAKMSQMTCVSPVAQSACATYHSQCPAVSIRACEADLGAKGDDEIVNFVDPCMEGLADIPATCGVKFRLCAAHLDHAVNVSTACTALKSSCSAINMTTCTTNLDASGNGVVAESTYQVYIPEAMVYEEVNYGATCGEAFNTAIGL